MNGNTREYHPQEQGSAAEPGSQPPLLPGASPGGPGILAQEWDWGTGTNPTNTPASFSHFFFLLLLLFFSADASEKMILRAFIHENTERKGDGHQV